MLAFVVWVSRTFDLQQQVNLDVVQLVLFHRQNQIILEEQNFIFVTVFASFIHVVQNFVLFLDQKRALDFGLPLLFVVLALDILRGVVELPRGHELLERYLLDWAVLHSFVHSWTEAGRRAGFDFLEGDGLSWHGLLSAHGVLFIQFIVLAHHFLQVVF